MTWFKNLEFLCFLLHLQHLECAEHAVGPGEKVTEWMNVRMAALLPLTEAHLHYVLWVKVVKDLEGPLSC